MEAAGTSKEGAYHSASQPQISAYRSAEKKYKLSRTMLYRGPSARRRPTGRVSLPLRILSSDTACRIHRSGQLRGRTPPKSRRVDAPRRWPAPQEIPKGPNRPLRRVRLRPARRELRVPGRAGRRGRPAGTERPLGGALPRRAPSARGVHPPEAPGPRRRPRRPLRERAGAERPARAAARARPRPAASCARRLTALCRNRAPCPALAVAARSRGGVGHDRPAVALQPDRGARRAAARCRAPPAAHPASFDKAAGLISLQNPPARCPGLWDACLRGLFLSPEGRPRGWIAPGAHALAGTGPHDAPVSARSLFRHAAPLPPRGPPRRPTPNPRTPPGPAAGKSAGRPWGRSTTGPNGHTSRARRSGRCRAVRAAPAPCPPGARNKPPWPTYPAASRGAGVREAADRLVRAFERPGAGAASRPGLRGEAAILNFYWEGDTLGGHRDDAERDLSLPIVSLSVGCAGVFLLVRWRGACASPWREMTTEAGPPERFSAVAAAGDGRPGGAPGRHPRQERRRADPGEGRPATKRARVCLLLLPF